MTRIHYSTILMVVVAVVTMTWHNPLLLGELIKNIFIAFVLARLAVHFHVCNCKAALQLGMGLWIGFQSVLLTSTVLHQRMPWTLYAIHADNAPAQTFLMSVILGIRPS